MQNVPSLLSWLAPVDVPDLIRVGGQADGGYVLPACLLTEADSLVSMGLGYSWDFEREAIALNPSLRLRTHVYDHTVGAREYRRDFWTELASFLCLQSPWSLVKRRYGRMTAYRQFFRHEAIHFRECITPDNVVNVLHRAGQGRLFVKVDIEGTEYDVLAAVLRNPRVIGLAIEFHDTATRRGDLVRLMTAALKNYAIVHLHGNNFCPVADDGLPEALEITLARRDYVHGVTRRTVLPGVLDRPNNPAAPDYQLRFASSDQTHQPAC
jgi:hypothetical protein